MRRLGLVTPLFVFFVLTAGPASAAPIPLGQVDTFENGTVENWVVGLLGAPHPAPPSNVATGGPGGANDNFMLLTAVGGQGAGSRLSAINLVQWAGDYLGGGVTALSVDFNNFSNSDLVLRLMFEDPMGGPPTNVAVSSGFFLPANSGWMTATFDIGAADLTALLGSVNAVLGNTTALRIIHTGAGDSPEPVVTLLGVDNIRATAVPEPATALLVGLGLLVAGARRRRA